MSKQIVKDKPYGKEIMNACGAYVMARQAGATAQWNAATKAYMVKEVCEKKKVPYLTVAARICNVTRSAVTMDVKAEEVRRESRYRAANLPVGTVSAFYELHRAKAAGELTSKNPKERKAAEVKFNKVLTGAAKGEFSVREIRKIFAKEFKKAAELRRKGPKPEPPAPEARATDVSVEGLDSEGLKKKVDEVNVPAGLSTPVVTVIPYEPTAEAIVFALAQAEVTERIANARRSRGPVWILLDLDAAEKRLSANLDQAATKTPRSKPGKQKKPAESKVAA